MGEKIVKTNLPVRFEKVEDYDSRFQKVKIWLMHLGKNYNGSIFSKESVLNALESLKNTPILGYIEESMLGDKDFAGHEVELVIENGEMKERYLGKAFGVIGESCNPRFEFKEGDNGEVLEYLVVDGILWSDKFSDAISILEESGEVGQSMELHSDYDGFWDEEGWFNFTKFSFYGACMLGKNVSPAMQKASVEMVFSKDVIKDEISRKLEEFSILMENKSKEVSNKMTLEELLAKYSISVEDLTAKEINAEEFSIEDLEAKIQEVFGEDNPDEDEENLEEPKLDNEKDEENENKEPELDNSLDNEEEDKDGEDKFTLTFQLSHDDIRSQMWSQIDDFMATQGFEQDWYYLVSVFDDNAIVQNDLGNKFYKVDYTKENDTVIFGSVTEVYPMFLTQEEKGALELMRANFEKIESENTRLKEFEAKVLEEQRIQEIEDLFARPEFSKLEDDDLAEIKPNISQFSVKELESKLYEVLGRKNAVKFSKQKTQETPKLNIKIEDEETKFTSPYSHILKRQGLI